MQEENGLLPLIKLISTNGPDLLVNVSEALGQCAKDKEVLHAVIEIDGVRLLWSLLKNPFEKVQQKFKIKALCFQILTFGDIKFEMKNMSGSAGK